MTPAAIVRTGFVDQNPGLVQLLGLCPLLALSTSLGSGLGLGLATLAVLVASNTVVSALGRAVPQEVRIPCFVLVIATFVTLLELMLAAWLPGLRTALGIFLPLIVSNCLVLARAETFASRQPVAHAALDGLAMGGGFLAVLVALGSAREVLGHGTLGGDLHVLFGGPATVTGLHFFGSDHGLQVALLPPGAFILLGLGLAWRQARAARTERGSDSEPTPSSAQDGHGVRS